MFTSYVCGKFAACTLSSWSHIRRHNNRWNCFIMSPPIDRCVGGVMFSGCPSVSASCQHDILQTNAPNLHQTLVDYVVAAKMNWLGLESRIVNVTALEVFNRMRYISSRFTYLLTARSYIWVSYCGRRRHPHRRSVQVNITVEVQRNNYMRICTKF